jgi:hypothetical protein
MADAKIKSGIAALALGDEPKRPYNPLYARAFQTPRPWGITGLFTEYTGVHEPVALDWSLKALPLTLPTLTGEPAPGRMTETDALAKAGLEERPWAVADVATPTVADTAEPAAIVERAAAPAVAASPDRRAAEGCPTFETVWDFAKALNRSAPAALALAAAEPQPDMPVEGVVVKKLLGTFWFRSVFPHLSQSWRRRLLDALAETLVIPNPVMRHGRRSVRLAELSYDQLKEISAKTLVRGEAGTDLQLLIAIGQLWGQEAFGRLQFVETSEPEDSSRLAALLGFRG